MTGLVLLSRDADLSELRTTLQHKAPDFVVSLAGESAALQAEIAVCWNPPQGSLGALPNLQLVHSMAAGVDHLSHDLSMPDVAVCRVVDPDLRRGMAEYVVWGVLHHHRHFDQILAQQAKGLWQAPTQHPASTCTVGIMGLGDLGAHVAGVLASLGFNVRGWARSAKALDNVATWASASEFDGFLDGVDCLVCLIPLTDETRGILNATTFGKLRHGAVLINCGRGGHLVLPDLVAALKKGQLRAALLDVFEHEPLKREDPIWRTPGITVTPHIASSASTDCIADQVIANVRRLKSGEPLLNEVNRGNGY